ncbi:MAG: hypothetical protein IKR82_04800 [Bacteroidales bacterium]|nr:hypothetical protein [Bacteroidales bacterium]
MKSRYTILLAIVLTVIVIAPAEATPGSKNAQATAGNDATVDVGNKATTSATKEATAPAGKDATTTAGKNCNGKGRNDKGYYKDIFMDGGIVLNSRTDLPSTLYMGYSLEYFASAPTKQLTAVDTMLQTAMMVGSAIDENGCLLYPDGAPRFRMIYVNGGKSVQHGKTLGEEGLQRFRDFVANGGSYLGSCAGAYMTATYIRKSKGPEFCDWYPRIWPGMVRYTQLGHSWIDLDIEPGSALLKYYDFGGDMRIDSVRHNGGCSADTSRYWPKGTEILARYNQGDRQLKRRIHGEPAIWAYKADALSGRVIACGSHPESVLYGERNQLMAAMEQYAMEGNGLPRVKAELTPGEVRVMDKFTHDADPAFTRIGDKQYHHFTVEVPEGCDSLVIKLDPVKGAENYDLWLLAHPGDFAFLGEAAWLNVDYGVKKHIGIKAPKAGTLYISVYCNTTVDTITTDYGTQYTGRTDVLNGVPYKIKVSFPAKSAAGTE